MLFAEDGLSSGQVTIRARHLDPIEDVLSKQLL
jgi:hypothetical protein